VEVREGQRRICAVSESPGSDLSSPGGKTLMHSIKHKDYFVKDLLTQPVARRNNRKVSSNSESFTVNIEGLWNIEGSFL